MSVTGPCAICESAPAEFACDRCGRVVCEAHHDEETGLCAVCAAEVTRGRDRSPDRQDRGREDTGDDRYTM
ncbi:MAG: hypothetical protein ABEJ70_02715 [Halobacteriaceae archaeon]